MARPIVVLIANILSNNSVIRIVAALPNPEGIDRGAEWVELQNSTNESIDITDGNCEIN
ncbi:MAG: hypothetical protein WBA13_10730 [Microcoleaceae cyanobacterium]